MADLGLLNPVAVQDLADRLAAAELKATQQQQEVVKVGLGRVGVVGRRLGARWISNILDCCRRGRVRARMRAGP
jgi:hypothetical protein